MSKVITSNERASIDAIILQIRSGEKLSAIAMSAIVVAKRLKNADLESWLKLELNGYLNTNPDFHGETIPEYRTVVGNYFDGLKQRIEIENPALAFVNENRLRNGIEELEQFALREKSSQLHDPARFKLIEDSLKVTVRTFVFQHTEVLAILNQLKTQLLTKLLDLETTTPAENQEISIMPDVSQVFVVHGHDVQAQVEVARFIEKLGLIPIILHEQASSGKTIIEKIEAYSNVGFGIVLYTPCDIGAMKGQEKHLQSRARQNVIFEHGYLNGKLGRDRVSALVKDTVETPSDISGVVYTLMDTHGAWEMKVAKEMKAAGYLIDMNKL